MLSAIHCFFGCRIEAPCFLNGSPAQGNTGRLEKGDPTRRPKQSRLGDAWTDQVAIARTVAQLRVWTAHASQVGLFINVTLLKASFGFLGLSQQHHPFCGR
ncbi:hypothetical protein PMIN06_000526 [Paraphaeosphaeria minitans]